MKLTAINVTLGLACKSHFDQEPNYKLGNTFEVEGQKFIIVTPMTAKAYEAARDVHQKHMETYYSPLMGCLMVEFEDLILGIEDDGYAHS